MEKFTKGEWSINKDSCWVDNSWSIDMAEHHCAATVVTCFEGGESNAEERARLEANAHLIAAAPDLYAEIKADLERMLETQKLIEGKLVDEKLNADIKRKTELLGKARGEL